MKRIVIIGAGYSGVLTAKGLAKRFNKSQDVSITIIDKNPFHTMLTELHEVAAGRVEEDSIRLSLKRIFAGRGVKVVLDTVQTFDFEKKLVLGQKDSYGYDYLVIAAGSRSTFFKVEGAKEHSYTLWSYDDAIKLKDRIQACFREAASETDIEKKRKLLTFYVVGAGFTGTEMVSELAEYVPFLCDKYEINRSLVTVCDVDILPQMVPVLPKKLSDKIMKRLDEMSVKVMLNTNVVSIGEDYIDLQSGEKVTRTAAGTVIWVAGIESSEITGKAALTLPNANRGRIVTDAYLRSVENKDVFAVGDNLCYTVPGEKQPVPQMVENCEQSAHTAAYNIYCAITGKEQMHEYKPSFHGVMVSVGGRYGVARVGTAKNMVNLPSFFAMFVKHFINIVYFVQVLGWNKVFNYLKHEFFTIRNRRSFVGGHFSNRTPSFLLVPIRLWLGAAWLYEGIVKVKEGWFLTPKLESFFGGANAWYNSILNGGTDAASSATSTTSGAVADSVSSATAAATTAAAGAVEAVGQIFLNFNFLGLFKTIFVSGKAFWESTFSDFAFKLDIPIMNWFINTVILPYDWIQIAMQAFIVIAEILIGLSLIGGLFTTPSSALSLVLQFMFVCTTGLYLNTIWMIFAGIATLYASGSIFGLDYYVIPALKKTWKKLPFVRRLYIYND